MGVFDYTLTEKRYRVKTWMSMAREYGLDEQFDIPTPMATFTKSMEEAVSKQPNRMIKVKESEKLEGAKTSDGKLREWRSWVITPEMLASVEDELRDIQRKLKNET